MPVLIDVVQDVINEFESAIKRLKQRIIRKHQYLAAGKPIVCNIKIAYDNVIEDNHLGVSRNIETPQEYVDAIRSIVELPKEEYEAMCKRVRETAEHFDYKVLAARELAVVEGTQT